MISLASRTKPPDSSTSVARQAAIIALALSIPDHTENRPLAVFASCRVAY